MTFWDGVEDDGIMNRTIHDLSKTLSDLDKSPSSNARIVVESMHLSHKEPKHPKIAVKKIYTLDLGEKQK